MNVSTFSPRNDTPNGLAVDAVHGRQLGRAYNSQAVAESNSRDLRVGELGPHVSSHNFAADVPPLPTTDDVVNRGLVDAVLLGEILLRGASTVEVTDSYDGSGSQFRVGPSLTDTASALGEHIGHVLAMASEEEMLRADAAPHITAMTHELARPYWADECLVSKPVCREAAYRAVGICDRERAVSGALKDRALPKPARLGLLDHLPKAIHQRHPAIVTADEKATRSLLATATACAWHERSIS